MHRTLKPNGIIVVSTWKRFGASKAIKRAHDLIDQDSLLMKIPKAEFMQDGYLWTMVTEAGFKDAKQLAVSVVCPRDDCDSLRGFVLGDFTTMAREKYTETKQARRPVVIT